MRTLMASLAALAVTVGVSVAGAAPARHHRRPSLRPRPQALTINTAPNPDVTGDPVTIYGQLNRPSHAGRTVTLWHRLPGQRRFTRVLRTTTDAQGVYTIPRAEGIVRTNRAWFVSVRRIRSRIVRERVLAELTIHVSRATVLTNHREFVFGHVTPNHRRERVLLQRQAGTKGGRYHTIGRTRITRGSNYVFSHRFKVPSAPTLRVLFRGDRRNVRSASSDVSITVQQAENPAFTLNSSADPITVGQSVDLSGKLLSTPDAGVQVALFARRYRGQFAQVLTTTTASDGSYSFAGLTPQSNTVYQVRADGQRHTAQLFEAVRDAVTLTASSTTPTVGQPVTLSGQVAPSKVGHVVDLQRLGDDSAYHTVGTRRIGAGSQYAFARTFRSTGSRTFRVLVPGGPVNARGISPSVTITVGPAPTP